MGNNAIISPKRIQIVDGLRGFALLGIILAHYGGWHSGYSLPNEVYQKWQADIASQIVWTFDSIFVSGKFFSFFSFLFGVSFGLMFLRQKADTWSFSARFAWRLAILGLIGILHHIHWRGDILSIYAIIGFFLLPFQKVSNKVVLVVGLILAFNLPNKIYNLADYFIPKKAKTENIWNNVFPEKETIRYYETIKSGNYLAFVEDNARAFDNKMLFQVVSGRLFITFGFFLLGFWTSRRKLFEFFEENRKLFRKILLVTGITVLSIIAIFLLVQALVKGQYEWLNLVFDFLYDSLNACMTLFLIAGMSFLFQKKSWAKILQSFSVIGKMALTSYLTQTFLGLFIFFGFGFGLMGKVSPAVGYLIGIGVFICQIYFSKWWLSRYQFGPVEWLWRSLTYLKMQPMKRN